jgi:hypothetical protein
MATKTTNNFSRAQMIGLHSPPRAKYKNSRGIYNRR